MPARSDRGPASTTGIGLVRTVGGWGLPPSAWRVGGRCGGRDWRVGRFGPPSAQVSKTWSTITNPIARRGLVIAKSIIRHRSPSAVQARRGAAPPEAIATTCASLPSCPG